MAGSGVVGADAGGARGAAAIRRKKRVREPDYDKEKKIGGRSVIRKNFQWRLVSAGRGRKFRNFGRLEQKAAARIGRWRERGKTQK